ncbi:carbamoyltransferase HypF [Geomonas sp.]|uniref:carbamoyltransferase HypF n=1 Tax=Geomonas sp. TaxID=2651584 RepID=UPI002B4725EB|nr:carbamoyltransferase HypF [Geomonas sp.]HJV36034.1 carbamoyltransferase HypF [Geomonas sp.]
MAAEVSLASTERERAAIEVTGIVQGVGFRPFVYRLAQRLRLAGWVRNTGRGVDIEVEGDSEAVRSFPIALKEEAPPLAVISSLSVATLAPKGENGFAIFESAGTAAGGEVPPDCEVCDDCLAELFDPSNRRYLYPFINCTNCGPRYSIITGIPYDRPVTTMAPFAMCPECLGEYHDPGHRRFHAQPNACPVCGPRLRLCDGSGQELEGDPLYLTQQALRSGEVVAIKGVGGFHLAVDACNEAAVRRLRERKHRDEKPFALLVPDLDAVRRIAHCGETEARLLMGTERPVVLLPKLAGNTVAPQVAPHNHWLGIMLPSNPLQHLLFKDQPGPLVMTSGNLSGEPIVYREEEAFSRLSGIADLFLTHNREIKTRSDDSVIRVFRGEPLFLRRSRGYVPRAVRLPSEQPAVLAVGGELKNAFCLTRGDRAFMSQHIGDLTNTVTVASLEENVEHLEKLLEIEPQLVAHDLHPDYLSTAVAQRVDLPRVAVQHHHAHLASCMAENGLDGEAIGVIFDGTGYGLDGAIWGGEFLVGGYHGFQRRGHLSYLRLPGGDAAVKEPYRMAIAALHGVFGDQLFEQGLPVTELVEPAQRGILLKMIERGINSPLTSSCGRLFDAVAALIGVRTHVNYEGQAAMELEALAERAEVKKPYPYLIHDGSDKGGTGGIASGSANVALVTPPHCYPPPECLQVDFLPAIAAICEDLAHGRDLAEMAAAFHLTLTHAVVDVCGRLRSESGLDRVVLSGGVFQNRLFTESVADKLEEGGFKVFCHRLVPPNDGGLALGQAMVAAAQWSGVGANS